MELAPGQLLLNNTFRFGCGLPVDVAANLNKGARGVRTQDHEMPFRAGLVMGRDVDTAPEWMMTLIVTAATDTEVRTLLDEARAAWQGPQTPAAYVPLRFNFMGADRQVFGRPRRWQVRDWHSAKHSTRALVDASFQLAEPHEFGAQRKTVTVGMTAGTEGGWVLPARFPLAMGMTGQTPAGERRAMVGGNAPAPLTVTFRGPIQDGWVQVGARRLKLAAIIPDGGAVVADAISGTVTDAHGTPRPGYLHHTTPVAALRVPPGAHDIHFGGIDPTATASVEVAWHDTYFHV